jgi:hypothetical protein
MAGKVSRIDNLGDNAFNQYKWEGQGEFMEGILDPSNCPIEAIWLDLYRYSKSKLSNKNVETISEDLVPLEAKKSFTWTGLFFKSFNVF